MGLFKDSGSTGNHRWRYIGPGYGQNIVHRICFLEPGEVVTCSASHGYLGTPEDFVKHFQLV